ncbi:MAG: hypothetical protein C0599_08975 [Salinivirgaceae bacterium]|nr:MAG: hypothetical protein C0599_08975 [Salinivirgaceae bacterium]
MKIVKILIQTIITLIIAFAIFLTWATFSDYKPEEKILLAENSNEVLTQDSLSVLIWNIGYAGLGEDMDFFYDGGEKMQTSKGIAKLNLDAILKFLESAKNNDFLLLQEVDLNSKRSYEIDQMEKIRSLLTEFNWYFAYNFKVNFVPMPLGNPLGKVNSGILSGSKFTPAKVTRHQFSGNYAWPKSIFMLDRCYTSMAFPLNATDTLFIVNTHNTAYDEGELRALQTAQLKEWVMKKYKNGNYVVVGGDWNQTPPNIAIDYFGQNPASKNFTPKILPEDFLPNNWSLIYDEKAPTNRGLNTRLTENSYKTLIDYFLISPNIKSIDIETINLDFKHSDHNPVRLVFKIK